jgi:DNA-binding CsgD family transcriptional regulator
MVEVTRGFGDSELTADLNLAEALGSFGRLGEATEQAKRVWEHSRQRILPSLATMAGQCLIPYLIRQGNLADAEDVALECIALEHRISGRSGRLTFPRVAMRSVHVLYQVIRMSYGEWRAAIDELRQELSLQPDPHHRLHPRQLIAVWLARLAGPESSAEVVAQLKEAQAEAEVAGCSRCDRELQLRSAEAELRIGRIDEATAHLEAWNSGRQADIDDQLWYRHCVALVSFARGDWRSGSSVLDQVQEQRRRDAFHYEALWGRLDLGARLSEPDPRRAAEEYRAAGAEAEAMGAATEARLAEVGLRKLGVRTWRRGPAARGPELLERLSQREREIARLVATGVSNPDIAHSLFLSRKTVERHVSNILARTGASNRTQLASLLYPEPDSKRQPDR